MRQGFCWASEARHGRSASAVQAIVAAVRSGDPDVSTIQIRSSNKLSRQRARFALHNQFLRVFIILSLHWSTKEELQFSTSTPSKAALAKSVFLIDARVSPAQIPSQMITGGGRSTHQLLYSINFRILNTPRPPNTQSPKHPRQNA